MADAMNESPTVSELHVANGAVRPAIFLTNVEDDSWSCGGITVSLTAHRDALLSGK